MMILGIILITLGLLGFICGLIFPFLFKNINWLFLIYTLFLLIPGIILLKGKPYMVPTKQDVLDGKAYYQETQIITGNDTIKTYDIIWKQENF